MRYYIARKAEGSAVGDWWRVYCVEEDGSERLICTEVNEMAARLQAESENRLRGLTISPRTAHLERKESMNENENEVVQAQGIPVDETVPAAALGIPSEALPVAPAPEPAPEPVKYVLKLEVTIDGGDDLEARKIASRLQFDIACDSDLAARSPVITLKQVFARKPPRVLAV